MKFLSQVKAACHLAGALQKWVLYISFDPGYMPEEILKAAPYLNSDEHLQILMDGVAIIICESAEECNLLYQQTVGDDGPTKTNTYNGPCHVYALTIDSDGQARNENT